MKRQDRYDEHHRRPKAQGGRREDTVRVPRKDHEAWHRLFPGHLLPEQIADIINTTWLDHRFKFVVVRRAHGQTVSKRPRHLQKVSSRARQRRRDRQERRLLLRRLCHEYQGGG